MADKTPLRRASDHAREHPTEDHHPGRRRTDHLPWWVGSAWRNLIPIVALALATYAVAGLQSDVDQQRTGRRVAINVLCGFGNGTAAAGRETLRGGLPGDKVQKTDTGAIFSLDPGRLNRFLQAHGYGTPQEQIVRSNAAAVAYTRNLSKQVLIEAGVKGDKVVQPDGTLDCQALRKAASAVKTPDDQ